MSKRKALTDMALQQNVKPLTMFQMRSATSVFSRPVRMDIWFDSTSIAPYTTV